MKTLITLLLLASTLNAQTFWNTVHGETWGEGDIPPTGIPWKYITAYIPFAGNTGGPQTNATSPYFQAPSGYEDAYHQTCHTLAKANGVKYLLDLGFNQSGQFCAVERANGIATWAQTVGDYMIQFAYDGADFDLEGGGCYANISNFAMALKQYLAVKNPGKSYTLTTSIMMNAVDVMGWKVPQAVAGGWLDQVNGMWYDQCYPETSPLFPSSTHHCWSNDSAMVFQFAAIGIPRNKIGLGYAIQVYTGCNTCYAKLGQQIGNMMLADSTVNNAGVFWDSESKARWYSLNGFNLAYEDTLTGWYKADFIKRNGFGGAMGFCLGRGYIAKPPRGWDHNPAAYGVGRALLGATPLPIDTTHPPVDTTHPPVVVRPALLYYQIADQATGAFVLHLSDGATLNIHGRLPFTLQAVDSAGLASRVTWASPASYSTTGPPFYFGWPWRPALGTTQITANPISASGAVGPTLSITIKVVNDSGPTPPPVTCFTQHQIDSAYGQGRLDEWNLFPDSIDVSIVPPAVQPPTLLRRVPTLKPPKP